MGLAMPIRGWICGGDLRPRALKGKPLDMCEPNQGGRWPLQADQPPTDRPKARQAHQDRQQGREYGRHAMNESQARAG